MTRFVAGKCEKLTAIELDHALVVRLQEEFIRSGHVSILEGNILEIEQRELLETTGYAEHGYKLVANIPYYITAPIIKTFLTVSGQPKLLVLMVQKEVAERLQAPAGETSLLSVMAQYYADVEYMFTVPREAFTPPPKVESAVVRLRPKRVSNETADRKFFRVVRIGFAARRKTLLNNLMNGLHRDREETEAVLRACGFRPDIRAQALSVFDWEELVGNLEKRALLS
jgi:16S rRNA (adenine1518-N6/adenine1519-N6)-dimethyltransferase